MIWHICSRMPCSEGKDGIHLLSSQQPCKHPCPPHHQVWWRSKHFGFLRGLGRRAVRAVLGCCISCLPHNRDLASSVLRWATCPHHLPKRVDQCLDLIFQKRNLPQGAAAAADTLYGACVLPSTTLMSPTDNGDRPLPLCAKSREKSCQLWTRLPPWRSWAARPLVSISAENGTLVNLLETHRGCALGGGEV